MLTLGIRYLQGVVVAAHGEHGRVEWPPHPARVFMAMVAAHYQTGGGREERTALLSLESLAELPEIYAAEALPCAVPTQFVPINDKAGPSKALLHSLPLTRKRQSRVFARASLASDLVALHWPAADFSEENRMALDALCAKVTRIGHSTSLVQMWVADRIPADLPCWVPNEEHSTQLFRVPRTGTLTKILDPAFNGEAVARYCELLVAEEEAVIAAGTAVRAKAAAQQPGVDQTTRKAATEAAKAAKKLVAEAKRKLAFEFPRGEPPQVRPRISTYAGYARADAVSDLPAARGCVFSPYLAIFTLEREDGPLRTLDLACTLALTDRWRQALASHANDLDAETQSLLTGHAPGGAPTTEAHVAFLPLAFVGHPHANGSLPGVALVLPEKTPAEIRAAVLRTAARVSQRGLKLGRLGAWKLIPATMARPLESLRAATWTAHPAGAERWATVTPIAYDQHPKAKQKGEYLAEVTRMIAAGCERIGLPRPREVVVTPVSAHLGAPPAHAYPRLLRKDGSERRQTHAILLFDEPVRGPVLIGAGRYRGYGLCRPLEVHA